MSPGDIEWSHSRVGRWGPTRQIRTCFEQPFRAAFVSSTGSYLQPVESVKQDVSLVGNGSKGIENVALNENFSCQFFQLSSLTYP